MSFFVEGIKYQFLTTCIDILGGQSTPMAQIKFKVTHEQLQIREKIDSLEVQKLQFILIYIIYFKINSLQVY